MKDDKFEEELLEVIIFLSEIFRMWYFSDVPTIQQLIALDDNLIK